MSNPTVSALSQLFQRDLERLQKEVNSYPSDESLWIKSPGINNSAGNLALHISGNLQHFIGHIIGGTSYQRDRKAEFETEFLPRAEIQKQIESTQAALDATWAKIDQEDLSSNYPLEVLGHPMTTEFFLFHLTGHLNYHLGQINYHRRILSAAL